MKTRLNTLVAVIACMLITRLAAFAQLPSPSHGINFGNAMEATCGVGCWGTPPSQAMVNAVAAAGFNTVRIPCAWMTHSDRRGNIDATYMSQVQQLVDFWYCQTRHGQFFFGWSWKNFQQLGSVR